MTFDNQPEFNDIKLGETVSIDLPVYAWVTIGEWIQFINDNTKYTFSRSIAMLLDGINDVVFPPAFQKAQKALLEEYKAKQAENHPVFQMMKGFPGVTFETIPDPETFNDDTDDNTT